MPGTETCVEPCSVPSSKLYAIVSAGAIAVASPTHTAPTIPRNCDLIVVPLYRSRRSLGFDFDQRILGSGENTHPQGAN